MRIMLVRAMFILMPVLVFVFAFAFTDHTLMRMMFPRASLPCVTNSIRRLKLRARGMNKHTEIYI